MTEPHNSTKTPADLASPNDHAPSYIVGLVLGTLFTVLLGAGIIAAGGEPNAISIGLVMASSTMLFGLLHIRYAFFD